MQRMNADRRTQLSHSDLPLVEQGSDYDSRYSWRLEAVHDRLVLQVAGRVAQAPSKAFSGTAEQVVKDLAARRVVIDFMNCEYIASGAISYLVRYFKVAVGVGGHVLAVSPNEHVRGLMNLLGINAFLLTVDDDEAAERYFEAQEL
jgi:anti-anti-sigma factor